MRKVLLLFVALVFIAACSKDEFNPLKPMNGQKVELFLDHYSDVNNQRALLLPGQTPSPLSLREVDEREPGYTYQVRAKVIVPKVPMQDGPDRWFEFVEMITKEKYAGNESFEISLIGHTLFGSYLAIKKEEGQLMYMKLVLNPINEEVKQQLEEYIERRDQLQNEWIENKDLRAVVTHDPENWGKGYLVHSLRFNE